MLKPEISVGAALAVGTLVYAIHQNATPSIADIRSLPEGNEDVRNAERSASWISAGLVAGISLVARDPVIFVVGSGMVVAMAWWTRHANLVNPELKKLLPAGFTQSEPVPEMEEQTYMPFQAESAFAN